MYVSYDPAARATYIRFADEEVASTREFGDLVMADIDSSGELVGIEFLLLPNAITEHVLAPVIDAFPSAKVLLESERWLLPSVQASAPHLV